VACLESFNETTKSNRRLRPATKPEGEDFFVVTVHIDNPRDLCWDDAYSVDIIQRSFPDIKPFGIRWKSGALFVDVPQYFGTLGFPLKYSLHRSVKQ
jgi:hypothetical protein